MHLSVQGEETHKRKEKTFKWWKFEFCFLRLFFLMTHASEIVPSVCMYITRLLRKRTDQKELLKMALTEHP